METKATHKRNNKKQRRCFTYIEMMMVLLLMTILGGTLLYNMQGGVQEAHKIERQHAAYLIELALVHALYNPSQEVQALAEENQWQRLIEQAPLIDPQRKKNYVQLLQKNEIVITRNEHGQLHVRAKE